MTTISKSALVPYSAEEMYELVADVESYPRFLPWCRTSQILNRTDEEIEASIEIVWSGIHKTFTTRNTLHQFDRMDITLVTGPFRHLEGHWSFLQLGDQGCKVNLNLEFELAGHIFDKVFQPIFHHIANSLVEAFCSRAVEVYGH